MDIAADGRSTGRRPAEKGGEKRAAGGYERLESARAAMEEGVAAARMLASTVADGERLGLARSVMFRVVGRYWMNRHGHPVRSDNFI